MNRLMTQDEAAERLGVSASTVKRWREQRLISYFPGRPVLFDENDVEAFAVARAEAKRKKAAVNEPGTPEFIEKAQRGARMRVQIHFIRRDLARKRGDKK